MAVLDPGFPIIGLKLVQPACACPAQIYVKVNLCVPRPASTGIHYGIFIGSTHNSLATSAALAVTGDSPQHSGLLGAPWMDPAASDRPKCETPPRINIQVPAEEQLATAANVESAASPPFWNNHGRTLSTVSYQSIRHLRPTPILLEDHSEDDHESSRACWAKNVTVQDYVVVGGATGIGAYVVWNCVVETLKGSEPFTIRKRYARLTTLCFRPMDGGLIFAL